MEIYKRKVGYEDFGRTQNLVVTATTLYFPFLLTQNFEDIGIYTDVENPVYEIVNFSGFWDLTGNTGASQKACLILNNCTVSFTSTPISFYNANNGTLTANVSGCAFIPSTSTVQWTGPGGFTNNGNLTAGMNNLAAGTYTLKITDTNCDITYANYVLQQPQSLSFALNTTNSQTNVTTPGGCNGTASVTPQGGLPPYTYLWYSGNTSNVLPGTNSSTTGVTNLCAGYYNVQIVDANSTVVSGNFVITEPTPMSGSVTTTTNVSCNGGNTGSIVATATGGISPNGYTFVLSGPTPSIVTGSTGGAMFENLLACPSATPCYTLTVFDNVGNSTILPPISITQPIAVNPGISFTNVNCYGSSDGTITLSPFGGTAPYNMVVSSSAFYGTYALSSPVTINGLGTGTYTITTEDSLNCVGPPQTVTLKQKAGLNVNRTSALPLFNGYNIRCFSGTTGVTFQTTYYQDSTTTPLVSQNIKYYLNGNLMLPNPVANSLSVPPFTTSKTFSLGAGTHTITVVNSVDNCSATTVVTLTQPPMPLSFVGNYVITNGPGAAYTTSIDTVAAGSPCLPSPPGCVAPATCIQGIVNVNGGVAPYTVTWNMLPTITSTTGPAWGVGITSNPFCSNNTNYGIKVTVVDANGCTITSVLKFPRTLP